MIQVMDCTQLLNEAAEKISRFDAELILAHLLRTSRAELYIYDSDISNDILERLDRMVNERANGRPLQYIIGTAAFMDLEFVVTPDVFIPRPETELLVEKTIEVVRSRGSHSNTPAILDLGTGSGNIAISLTKRISACKITASDVSEGALCVARRNARHHAVEREIEFIRSDIFQDISDLKFDICVSNPPYVATQQIGRLQREIAFEPRVALDGGSDGLDFYRRLMNTVGKHVVRGGHIILELGYNMSTNVEQLLARAGFGNIHFVTDSNAIKRVACAQWINSS